MEPLSPIMFTFESSHYRAVGATYSKSRTTSLSPTKKYHAPDNKSSPPARGGAPGVVSESKHKTTPMSTKLAWIRKMQQRSRSFGGGTPQATAATKGKDGKARTITPLKHTAVQKQQKQHFLPKTVHQVQQQPVDREQANQPIRQHSTPRKCWNHYQPLHLRQQSLRGGATSNTDIFPPRRGQTPTTRTPPKRTSINKGNASLVTPPRHLSPSPRPPSPSMRKMIAKYGSSPKNDDFPTAPIADRAKRAGANGMCTPLSSRRVRYAEIMELKRLGRSLPVMSCNGDEEDEVYYAARELRVFEQEDLLEKIEDEIREIELRKKWY